MYILIRIYILSIFALFLFACSGDRPLNLTSTSTNLSGYIVVSTVATDSTGGPGFVTLFNKEGEFVRTLYDFVSPDYVTGHGLYGTNELLLFVETAEDLLSFNLEKWTSSVAFGDSTVTGSPIRQMAVSSDDGSVYLANTSANTVEKLVRSSNGTYTRSGSPFISTSVGSCVLTSPWGMAYIPTTDQIAVVSISGSSSVNIYNADGSCATRLGGSPFSSNGPISIAYHALSNKLIVGFSSNHTIYSANLDGTGANQIFLDSNIISAIRSIAVDDDGYLYIGNATHDTVEKLFYNGTGSATRVLNRPLIGPLGTSSNPTQITVIP